MSKDKEDKSLLARFSYILEKRLKNINTKKIEDNMIQLNENLKLYNQESKNDYVKLENKINKLEKEITYLKSFFIEFMNENKKNNKKIITDIKNTNNLTKKISNKKNLPELEFEEQPLIKVNSISIDEYHHFKEIKKEKIILDEEIILNNLHQHNIKSDINLFKLIYIDNSPKCYYPIRNIKNHYQYWLNNKMNDDDQYGSYIKNTIVNNLQNLYLELNIYENYENNTDLFLKNQEYIMNMSSEKYKDKLLKLILKIINN